MCGVMNNYGNTILTVHSNFLLTISNFVNYQSTNQHAFYWLVTSSTNPNLNLTVY